MNTDPCQITRPASTPEVTEPCQITRQAQPPWKMPRGWKHGQTKADCAICRDHGKCLGLDCPLCFASFPNLFIVRLLPQHSAPRLRAALLWRSSNKGTTVVMIGWSHVWSMHWICRSVSSQEFNEWSPCPGWRMGSPGRVQAETRDRKTQAHCPCRPR